MDHKCDNCGEEFDTLARFRLHECVGDSPVRVTDKSSTDTEDNSTKDPLPDPVDREEVEREYPEVVGDLPDFITEARNGNLSILSQAIAEYEQRLNQVSRGDAPGGDVLRDDLLFAYYEPLADGLDTVAEKEGWDVLLDFCDAYDPHTQGKFPEVGHVIANAIGRSVIRTRQTDGVDAIPTEALSFLGAIPEYVDEFHVAYEESYTYGWGINHPDHSVANHLLSLAQEEPKFVKVTLNTTFYVDQHAAIDIFESLITDEDISGTRSVYGMETDLTEFHLKAVADLETEELIGPHAPPYWDEDDDLPRVIELDADVKQQIRDLVHKTDIADRLPADWSLQDLDRSVVSAMVDMMSARDDST